MTENTIDRVVAAVDNLRCTLQDLMAVSHQHQDKENIPFTGPYQPFKIHVVPWEEPKGIYVTWSYPCDPRYSDDRVCFRVKRAERIEGPYETVSLPLTTDSFVDSSVKQDYGYHYAVIAEDRYGVSSLLSRPSGCVALKSS